MILLQNHGWHSVTLMAKVSANGHMFTKFCSPGWCTRFFGDDKVSTSEGKVFMDGFAEVFQKGINTELTSDL